MTAAASRGTRGPRWADVGAAGVVSREITEIGRERSRMGRSTIDVRCPFCSLWVTAYKWSMAGGGKRCACGALLGWHGQAHHFEAT
jgi:hypothetical protein